MKVAEQGALTNWRQRSEGQIITPKESDRGRGTHNLETAVGGMSQELKATEGGALTL